MSDKAFTPPKPADAPNKTPGGERDVPKVQINKDDWKEANAKHQDGKGQTAVCDCKIVGNLDDKAIAKTVEELSKATTATARLNALGKLADGGVEKFSMKDKDGTTRQFRLETEKVGDSTLLHCYGLDQQKAEQVVMRASRSGDGSFKQQRYQDDRLASFHGDVWSRSMNGKSFLVGEVEKSERQPDEKKKGGNLEKKSDKKDSSKEVGSSESRKSKDGDSPKKRSHEDSSDGKTRKKENHSSDRDRDRDSDSRRSSSRDDRGSVRDRDRDRNDRSDRGERSERSEEPRKRFNLGETIGTVTRFVAPFLLSALDRNRYGNDCNPYQRQQIYRSDRGYDRSYDYSGDGYERYSGGRQDQCGNDYDRRYGNRNYYDSYGQNRRYDRNDHHDRRDRNDRNNNRRNSNWLSKLFN